MLLSKVGQRRFATCSGEKGGIKSCALTIVICRRSAEKINRSLSGNGNGENNQHQPLPSTRRTSQRLRSNPTTPPEHTHHRSGNMRVTQPPRKAHPMLASTGRQGHAASAGAEPPSRCATTYAKHGGRQCSAKAVAQHPLCRLHLLLFPFSRLRALFVCCEDWAPMHPQRR